MLGIRAAFNIPDNDFRLRFWNVHNFERLDKAVGFLWRTGIRADTWLEGDATS